MDAAQIGRKPLYPYYLLVLALSVPFWLLGFAAEDLFPAHIPVSALQAVCPAAAAVILAGREGGRRGFRMLLKRVFAFKLRGHGRWYALGILIMPVIMLLSYGATRLTGKALPDPDIPYMQIPLLIVVFSIFALLEETGWSGYATDPMQKQRGALAAGIVLGDLCVVPQ